MTPASASWGDKLGPMTTFAAWTDAAGAITSGGLRLAVHDLGPRDAPTVTYLHGYPASSLDIAPIADRLADRVRFVTLDFAGFGASDKPDGHPYSIAAQADAVQAMWSALGVTRTVLFAHDYGVSVGQELLARRAEGTLGVAVDAAVWSNGGLYPDLHRPTAGQALLLDPDQGPALAAAMDESMFRAGIAVTWGTRAPMPDAEIGEMWRSVAHDGGHRLLHQLLHYVADRRANAARWAAALEANGLPQWFVWGDLDPVSGAHMVERVEERVPDAHVVRLADVGHWPPIEAPTEVTAALTAATGT